MENTLGDVIRKIREKASHNQTEFGKAIGVVTNTVSAYERGDRLPEIDTLIKICTTYHADLTELIKLRVLASPQLEIENQSLLAFLGRLNNFALIPGLPNHLAKQQLQTLQSASRPIDADQSRNQSNSGYEIHSTYFLNCYRAYYDFYNKQQPSENDLADVGNVISVHNFINKLSPVLGVDEKNVTTLESPDIEKLMLALSVLDRIPKPN